MSCCELEFAVLIPSKKPELNAEEPYFRYKGTECKKTVRLTVPSWHPIKSRLKRLYNWLSFVWCHSRAKKCRKVTFLTLFFIFLFLFTIIFVLIPVAFKNSKSFQQHTVFNPTINTHESYNTAIKFVTKYEYKTFQKPKNMFVTVNKHDNVSLGVWSITQHKHSAKVEQPYLLYFHNFVGDRKSYVNAYRLLSNNFRVITFDYRGYGDSSQGKLSERDLVNDGVQLYKWLRQNTNSSIYVWGDQMGAAVAAGTVAKLQEEKIEPIGVILENPFLSTYDYLKHTWFIAKMVSYTFWDDSTIVNPLTSGDLYFSIEPKILSINSPIMFFLYGRRRHTFDNYINSGYVSYNTFDSNKEHIRMKGDISYFFDYESYHDDITTVISNFIYGCDQYRNDRNKS